MSEHVIESVATQDRDGECETQSSVTERKRKRNPAGERFDYSQVPLEAAKHAKEAAGRYRAALKRIARDILEIGRMLIQVQDSLDHGLWMKWREVELGVSHHSVTDWMNCARTFSGVEEMVEHLNLGALKLLARAPEPIRQRVMAKSQKGEVRTKQDIERAIAEEEVASEFLKPPQGRSLKKEIEAIRRKCFSSDFALLWQAIDLLSKAASAAATRQEILDRSDPEYDAMSLADCADEVLQRLYAITGVILDSEGQQRRLTGLSKELEDVLRGLATLGNPGSKCATEFALLASYAKRLAALTA
jgi:hypothetical protein